MKRNQAQWERTFQLIKKLRANRNAPVDESGPRAIADKTAGPRVFQYQVLCALQLSSMTKDQKVHEAMEALKKFGLTVENIAKTPAETIEDLIKPVGFYRRKAVYMRDTAVILIEKHDGEVPQNVEALMSLPGIGPKMAHITLSEAFGVNEGIGVDSHMQRICNQLGWANAKDPETVRAQLEGFLPKSVWGEINHEIVGLGQMIQQPSYRVRLGKSLLDFDDDFEFREAFAILKKLGFTSSAVGRSDVDLQEALESRERGVKRPRQDTK